MSEIAPEKTVDPKKRRPLRSYVLRQGRMTPAQKLAIATHFPEMGLIPEGKTLFDWPTIFGRKAPLVLEIGFGMGDTLVSMASTCPEQDFIGVEVHQPGVGACLAQAKALALSNIRVIAHDAYQVLTSNIPAASIDKVLLLFPDPWPKARHHKRRLLQPAFVCQISRVLKPGGILHCATDWQPYAEHMLAVLQADTTFINHYGDGQFAPGPYQRPETKFERRGQRLGHSIYDLVFVKS